MRLTAHFTKHTLDSLEPSDKQYDVTDTGGAGLRIMVNTGGTKTFFIYRKVRGRPQRIKIGRYPDVSIENARKEAKRLNSLISLGHDPHSEKIQARREPSFKELADRYYAEHAVKHTKRPDDNRRMLEVHAFPALGSRKCTEITKDQIRQLHLRMGEHSGPGGANRVMHVISAVFNFGIKNGYIQMTNPCQGLTKFKVASRDRFLTTTELSGFFTALEAEKPLFQDYFLMALHTGARKGNLLAMKWSDIDLANKRWRISEKESKNGDVNIVPLSAQAIEILTRRQQARLVKSPDKVVSLSPYVFPGKDGQAHLKDPKRAFTRIKERMKVEDIRIHDLRRTLGSYMAMSGAGLPIIGKALNHRSTGATNIYARLANDPVLHAMQIASDRMATSPASAIAGIDEALPLRPMQSADNQ